MKKKGIAAVGFSLLTLIASVVVILKFRDIRDWIALYGYEPSSAIAALSDRTSMTPTGRKLFYVYDPQLQDKASFNASCPINEQTIVLGCYDGRGIYIYDISDPRLAGVEEVTSAHEMLHAAYDRLSSSEKAQINELLEQALEQSNNQRIKNLVDSYRKRDPENLANELHSIIGTELRALPAELEEYYGRYFDDRMVVVGFSEQYESVFSNLKNQAEQLKADLSLRRAQIDSKEAQLAERSAELEAMSAELEELKRSNPQQYNDSIDAYNAKVNAYNSLLAEVKALIAEFNSLVATYNSLAVQQNQLVHNLDSKYQEY